MWVARDKDGELDLYLTKPIRFNYQNLPIEDDCLNNDFWDTDDEYLTIDTNLYPNLTWEDEPIEVDDEVVDNIIKNLI